MSGLLINLAVIRDAQPGKSLHYRFVDDGRVRDHQYVVAHRHGRRDGRRPQLQRDARHPRARAATRKP